MSFEEEAIEEELWQVITNLACSEEHLRESAMITLDKYLSTMDENLKTKTEELLIECNINRDYRKRTLNKILSLRNTNPSSQGAFRNITGEEWCKVKHYLLTKMHLFETAQKYLALFSKTKEQRYMEEALDCVNMAKDIHQLFLMTIEEIFPRKE